MPRISPDARDDSATARTRTLQRPYDLLSTPLPEYHEGGWNGYSQETLESILDNITEYEAQTEILRQRYSDLEREYNQMYERYNTFQGLLNRLRTYSNMHYGRRYAVDNTEPGTISRYGQTFIQFMGSRTATITPNMTANGGRSYAVAISPTAGGRRTVIGRNLALEIAQEIGKDWATQGILPAGWSPERDNTLAVTTRTINPVQF